mmetsp:Transcript_13460/g.22792  ORF Transcript_13460/g.22792 Transcript_13460/m.22792 type:complete len:117 (-) Transcript_13460:410-760(-)
MDQEQQFDDDVMLQIALQMSITEPAEVSAAPAESPEAVVSTEGTKEDSTAVPNEELPIDEALVLKDGSIVEETTAVLDKGGSSALPFFNNSWGNRPFSSQRMCGRGGGSTTGRRAS